MVVCVGPRTHCAALTAPRSDIVVTPTTRCVCISKANPDVRNFGRPIAPAARKVQEDEMRENIDELAKDLTFVLIQVSE